MAQTRLEASKFSAAGEVEPHAERAWKGQKALLCQSFKSLWRSRPTKHPKVASSNLAPATNKSPGGHPLGDFPFQIVLRSEAQDPAIAWSLTATAGTLARAAALQGYGGIPCFYSGNFSE